MKFGKLIGGVLCVAAQNKKTADETIINYHQHEQALRADGFLPIEEGKLDCPGGYYPKLNCCEDGGKIMCTYTYEPIDKTHLGV